MNPLKIILFLSPLVLGNIGLSKGLSHFQVPYARVPYFHEKVRLSTGFVF